MLDANPGDAQALLERTFAEQHALAEAMGRLVSAVGEQQVRLGRQLTGAVELLVRAGGPEHSLELTSARDTGVVPALNSGGSPRVVVRCLGTFEVIIDGLMREWRPGKACALFEYLLLHRRRPVPRETLIEALWPDPDAVAAPTSLKVAVHGLRRQLPDPPTIQAQPLGYQLIAPDLWLDVVEFEQTCERGRRLEQRGQASEALELYRRAVELYRGDLLVDSWADWILLRREGLKDQQLFMLARLADAALARGDYHGCIAHCQQILDEDPCREDAFRILILCHARLGQPGRVRRWYELCTRMLRSELDVEPAPETVELYGAATRHGPLPECRFDHAMLVS